MNRKYALTTSLLAVVLAGPLAAQEEIGDAVQDPAQQTEPAPAPDALPTRQTEPAPSQEAPPTQQTPPADPAPLAEDATPEPSEQAAPQPATPAADRTADPTTRPGAGTPGQQAMDPEMLRMMEAYQKAGAPGAEHQRMADMAGTYDMTIKSWHGPGDEPTTDSGTATRKMILGDRVMVEEVKSQMMGQPFTGHGMSGYDNVSDKYWATWIDSMSTGVMTSEGTCDADMACTYTGSYNDAISGQPKTVRMTSRWTDDSTEVFEMHGPGPDGNEMKMMEITYRKRGS